MASRMYEIQLRNGEKITLTERERLFCEYYIGECKNNATQSAIRAGYSKKTAKSQGQRLLTHVYVQKLIKDRTAPILEALGATTERVMAELVELAFSRPGQVLTKDSNVPLGYQDSITFKTLIMDGVEVDSKEKTVAFNYNSKMKALMIIAKDLGIIKKDSDMNDQQQVNILFQQINNLIQGN